MLFSFFSFYEIINLNEMTASEGSGEKFAGGLDRGGGRGKKDLVFLLGSGFRMRRKTCVLLEILQMGGEV